MTPEVDLSDLYMHIHILIYTQHLTVSDTPPN